ncbi:MAG: hypothetical protein ABIH09_04025 [Candidatus Omnitrophota bacterium]
MNENLTPMMRQYLEIKDQHKDAILFFRLGDFYEMFFDDAIKATKILHITLTARGTSAGRKIPMCGGASSCREQLYRAFDTQRVQSGYL